MHITQCLQERIENVGISQFFNRNTWKVYEGWAGCLLYWVSFPAMRLWLLKIFVQYRAKWSSDPDWHLWRYLFLRARNSLESQFLYSRMHYSCPSSWTLYTHICMWPVKGELNRLPVGQYKLGTRAASAQSTSPLARSWLWWPLQLRSFCHTLWSHVQTVQTAQASTFWTQQGGSCRAWAKFIFLHGHAC